MDATVPPYAKAKATPAEAFLDWLSFFECAARIEPCVALGLVTWRDAQSSGVGLLSVVPLLDALTRCPPHSLHSLYFLFITHVGVIVMAAAMLINSAIRYESMAE